MPCRRVLLVSLFLLWQFTLLSQETLFTVVAGENVPKDIPWREIVELYEGERDKFSNGRKAVIILPSKSHPDDYKFAKLVFDESDQFMRRHWLGLVFQGRMSAPTYLDSDEEIMDFIKSNGNAIAILINSNYQGRYKIEIN